jgi:hypothetical protein
VLIPRPFLFCLPALLAASTSCASASIHRETDDFDAPMMHALKQGVMRSLQSSFGERWRDRSVPWRIGVRDSVSSTGIALRSYLNDTLQPRPELESDLLRNVIGVSSVSIEGNTAAMSVSVLAEHRCRSGEWLGALTQYELVVTKVNARWGEAAVRPKLTTDPPPCIPDV